MTERRKTMHINLYGDHVEDYDMVRMATGITNDNDLVRYLFRQYANDIRKYIGADACAKLSREPADA